MKIVHVGAGARGRHWVDVVRRYAQAVSVAVVDPSEGARRRVEQRHPGIPRFESVAHAFSNVEADAAIVATPFGSHATSALACLEAGWSVMVEKPLAQTVAAGRAVAERAEQLGLVAIVAQTDRFNRAERTLASILADGELGSIHQVECTARRFQLGRETALEGLRHAQLLDAGVSHFDSLRSILGLDPVSVVARCSNPGWSDYEHGSVTHAMLEMSGDVRVQYTGTLTSHRDDFSLRVEGDAGVLWTNRKRVFLRRKGSRFFRRVKPVPVPRGDDAPDSHAGSASLLNALRDAIAEPTERELPETNARDNLWTLSMVEASMRSDRDGCEVLVAEIL